MRIIHLSDIHLSSSNIQDLRLNYRDSLLEKLEYIYSQKPIDLIIITGDLIDKAGLSITQMPDFKGRNPYDVFEDEFITPIYDKFPTLVGKIIFCAGNHDIESNEIHEITEAGLKALCTNSEKVNEMVNKYLSIPNDLNLQRLNKFKNFEEKIHNDSISNGDYKISSLESSYIFKYKPGISLGIAIINDSWRCTASKVENNVVGSNQYDRCLKRFRDGETSFNIVVQHHPIDKLTDFEKQSIERILYNKEFHIVLIGHEHSKKVFEENIGNGKKILQLRGRSAFDKPHEKESDYQSGFAVIDIDFNNKKIICEFFKYYKNDYSFRQDMDDGEPVKTFSFGVSEELVKSVSDKSNFLVNANISQFINNSEDE